MNTQKTYSSEREIAEIWKLFRETDQKINKLSGEFDRKWGRLVESLVEGSLIKLLNNRNIDIKETCERARGIRNAKDKHGKVYAGRCEIDILARNGTDVVTVEVKTMLNSKDVDHFLYKLKNFTCFFPGHKNNKIYGAMAYLTVNQNADEYAKKQGLFTIKATGDSARITNTKNFKPKIFPG